MYKQRPKAIKLEGGCYTNLVSMPTCLFFPHVLLPVPKVFMATGQSPRTCTSTRARPAPGPPMLTQLSPSMREFSNLFVFPTTDVIIESEAYKESWLWPQHDFSLKVKVSQFLGSMGQF